MVTKSKNAKPIIADRTTNNRVTRRTTPRLTVFEPFYAVVLAFDGKRVISDVVNRDTARSMAADINRDRESGYRASVRRVRVSVVK